MHNSGHACILGIMYYTASVYKNPSAENLISGISYNIIVTITSKEQIIDENAPSPYGEYVFSLCVQSKRRVRKEDLCYYLDWKFLGIHSRKNNKTSGIYIGIWHDIEWIKSILDVEFDYHIGKKKCKKGGNLQKLEEYKKSRYSGFKLTDMSLSKLNLWTNSLPAPPDQ